MSDPTFLRRVAALGQFRVDDPRRPELSRADEHHLRTVLRAAADEEVVVTDGRGTWAVAAVEPAGLRRLTDVWIEPAPAERTLYLAPLKGDRSEWAVIKASELGVTTIVPLLSRRVVVKVRGETRTRLLARWQRLADEASAQARRTHYPSIGDPLTPSQLPPGVAVCDFDGDGSWSDVASVAIGPEGGWEPGEWGTGRHRLSLGPTVLRSETAAVAAATLMAFHATGERFAHQSGAMRNDESSHD